MFSPHTTWDVIQGGVNDWLAKAFDFKEIDTLTPTGCGRKLQLAKPTTITDVVQSVKNLVKVSYLQVAFGKNHNIGNYLKYCTFIKLMFVRNV